MTPESGRGTAGRAVCTIVSKNYLPFARVFAASYLEHNPGGEVFVLLVDRADGYFDTAKEKFRLIELLDIGIDRVEEMLFKYSVIELNTAVKPFFLEYIFKNFAVKRLAYFDPDILALDSMDKLWGLLEDNRIILTPHLDSPIPEDGLKPTELDILRSGSYNLGFIGLADAPEVRGLLKWWQDKLRRYCYIDFERGYFVDQKWMEFIPGMFDGVHILRDPGYNMAYWNMHSRRVERRDGRYYINGSPARFFHFSGFHPDRIEGISKHQTRFSLGQREDLRPLFERYRDLVLGSGYRECLKWPYAFGAFDNGVEIPGLARRMYGYLPDEDAAKFGNPFQTQGKGSFFNWLNGEAGPTKGYPLITRLWQEIWKSREDLRSAFPDVFGSDRSAFTGWCYAASKSEINIDEAFLQGVGEGKDAGGPAVLKWFLRSRIFIRNLALKAIGNDRRKIDFLKKVEHRFRSRLSR